MFLQRVPKKDGEALDEVHVKVLVGGDDTLTKPLAHARKALGGKAPKDFPSLASIRILKVFFDRHPEMAPV